jgi:hypothetical protein
MANVRFGSKADIEGRLGNVRFTPKSGLVRCTKKALGGGVLDAFLPKLAATRRDELP